MADWPREVQLPAGFEIDEKDVTIVNSSGIAADGKGKVWDIGSEIKTPPTNTASGQCAKLDMLLVRYPTMKVNYRSNLHIHIRVPGLSENLTLLKKLADYNAKNLREILPIIDPIPKVSAIAPARMMNDRDQSLFTAAEWVRAYTQRVKRNRVSHHTVLPANRLDRQMAATTTEEFFEAEVPRAAASGKPQWQCQPRAAVNVRQLLETDTIEFRHFFGTTDRVELLHAIKWCHHYLFAALNTPHIPATSIWNEWRTRDTRMPRAKPFCLWQEVGYQATNRGHNTIPNSKNNIEQILNHEFDWNNLSYLSRKH